MKLTSLLYKKRISILGLVFFITFGFVKLLYQIAKDLIIGSYKIIRWIVRYIQFAKSGYTYQEIENIIQNMSGREFEKFCYYLFKELGYKTILTKASNDYGRDVIVEIDNKTIFVECKRYSDDNIVGREIVQKLSGSISMFNADKGIIITTGKYHKNALEAADMIGNIELWNMTQIMMMVLKVNMKRIPNVLMKSLNNNTKIIRLRPAIID